MRVSLLALLLVLVSWLAPRVANAGDRYFLILFASQSEPKQAKFTHVFASIIHARGEYEEIERSELTVYTISWMPATLDVRVRRMIPEEGVNLGLHATLEWAMSTGQQVAMWGPGEIRYSSYMRLMNRLTELQSGRVKYQCIDPLLRTRRISDCIHAISDVDPIWGRIRYPLIRFGYAAAEHFIDICARRGALIDTGEDHSWIISRLQLDCYPIEQRVPDHRAKHPPAKWVTRIVERVPNKRPCHWPTADFIIPPMTSDCVVPPPMAADCVVPTPVAAVPIVPPPVAAEMIPTQDATDANPPGDASKAEKDSIGEEFVELEYGPFREVVAEVIAADEMDN